MSELSSSGSPHSHNLCPVWINCQLCREGMGVVTQPERHCSNSCLTLSPKGELRRLTRGGSQIGRGDPDHAKSFRTPRACWKRFGKMGTGRITRGSESTVEFLLSVMSLLKMKMWTCSYLPLRPRRQVSVKNYELPGWKIVCSSKALSVFAVMLHATHHRCKG